MNNDIRKFRFETLSVAVIDDHEVVLEGFRSYMFKNGLKTVEAFNSAHALLERLSFRLFDVYVVDVELPDMNASQLIDEIRGIHPDARIIINTMHQELWVVRKMTEKQVDGVIYKSGSLSGLLKAIEVVTGGGQYFCSEFRKSSSRVQSQHDVLSRREQEVLHAIALGKSTKEIASMLYISESTVETHRQNLFTKLKAHNMADVIIKAFACGYLNPNEIIGLLPK